MPTWPNWKRQSTIVRPASNRCGHLFLPGGAAAAAQLHMARCICRRSERRLVELATSEQVRGELVRYLNRLSDLLFVLARVVNKANRMPDVVWQQEGKGGRGKGEGGK